MKSRDISQKKGAAGRTGAGQSRAAGGAGCASIIDQTL